jgi:hypothetical protein
VPRPDRRLTRTTVVPIARAPTAAVRSRVARTADGRLAAPAVARHRLRDGEPPSPVRRRRVVAGSPSSAAAPRVAVGRAHAVHVGRADAAGVGHMHCASGPSANSAQCTRLNFIDF